MTGVVRVPVGPLGTSGEPGDFRQMAIAPQDAPDEVFTTVILGSEWPVPATLEAVRPILRSQRGGAEVLGAQPYDHAMLGEDQQLVLGSVRDRPREWAGNHPVMGTQVPAAEGTGAVALVRVWNEPGAATDVAGYVIDYRIGPFAFRAVSTTNSIVLCTNDGVVPPDCDDGEQAASAVARLLADGPWQLLGDEPTRDSATLQEAATTESYQGSMARAFVFTVTRDDNATKEILVAPGANGDWQIATPLGSAQWGSPESP